MKNIIGMILAIVSVAGILSACGDGNKSLPRVVECPECSEAQLKVLLGRDASKATSGKNIVLTLQLTEANHDEIVAWISDGGNTPNALCREIVYEAVADHNSFINTQRWAIVRNNTTLFADNRQEHGAYLVDDYANIALMSRLNPKLDYSNTVTAARRTHKSAVKEATRAYKSTVNKEKSAYEDTIPAHPSIAYNAARVKSAVDYFGILNAINNTNRMVEKNFDRVWEGVQTANELCKIAKGWEIKKSEDICEALKAAEFSRKKTDESLTNANLIRTATISKSTSILDAAISQAQTIRDAAINKSASIRDAAIIKATRIYNSYKDKVPKAKEIYKQQRDKHATLSTAYQPGDFVRVLEQGEADKSLPPNDYRVIDISGTRLLAYSIALPNGQAANNCNAAPTANGQYYVTESGIYAWQGWR